MLKDEILLHIVSARWLIAIILTLTFSVMAYQGKIDSKDALLIISNAITFYYTKNRTENK